jgi:hypothetical protein
MKAYHRTDPLMDERKGHYSPGQLGAFVKVQLLAGRQTRRGRFRSAAALKSMLPGAYSRHVDFLVEQGDVIPATRHPVCDQCPKGASPRGEVYIDGWDEWQEGDLTVGERMKRLRNKKRNATVTDTDDEASPAAIGIGVGSSVGVGSPASAGDAREVDRIEVATRRLRNGNASERQVDTMRGLFEQVGNDAKCFAVLAQWEQAPIADRYGRAMAELTQLADDRKRSRGSRVITPLTNYDDLMQSDDDNHDAKAAGA